MPVRNTNPPIAAVAYGYLPDHVPEVLQQSSDTATHNFQHLDWKLN